MYDIELSIYLLCLCFYHFVVPVLDEYLSTEFLDKLGLTDEVKKTLILASRLPFDNNLL